MRILVKALRDDTKFDLRLELIAGDEGLDREIDNPRIQKPGLAMAGFVESLQPHRLQVLGHTEIGYLHSLAPVKQRTAIADLLSREIGCMVVTTDQKIPDALVEAASVQRVPLFRSRLPSSLFITRAQDFLDEHLSPEITAHAVLIDIFGVGVLLTGASGIGKSECALDLILRGHRLVADDVVLMKRRHRQLVGMGSPLTRHHMEVRGLGIISVKDLFGAASVRERKRIELVVELVEWQTSLELDRTGLDEVYEPILKVNIPKVRLPIRPGRNLASIVEVAARNHLLRLQGHHAARDLKDKLERQLAPPAEDLALVERD
jgi:HPr kinase/phosphorylase